MEMVIQRNNEKGEYEEVTLDVTLGAKKDMPQTNSGDEETPEDTEEIPDRQEYEDEFFDEFQNFFGN